MTLSFLVILGCNTKEKKTHLVENRPEVNTSSSDSESSLPPAGTLKVNVKRLVQLEKDFSNLEEFKASINSYKVQIEAVTGHFTDSNIECRAKGPAHAKSSFSGQFNRTGSAAEVKIDLLEADSSTVDYDCLVLHDGMEIDRVSVNLKKSYVISGRQNYMSAIGSSNIATLFLEEGVEISTEGRIVQMNVNELISLNAKIVTFPQEKVSTTQENPHGDSGGIIGLNIEKSIGKLDVELRGLNGGVVTNVPDPRKDRPAKDPSRDGNCPSRDPRDTSNCAGKKGAKGFKGLTGYQGRKGGNTGSLILNIEDSAGLELTILHFPGKGTAGGLGGIGGRGGPGGKGVTVTWTDPDGRPGGCIHCGEKSMMGNKTKVFPNGPEGDAGDRGDQGPHGDDGQIEISTINLKDRNINLEINNDWDNF